MEKTKQHTRVYVKAVEYGCFIYEGDPKDLEDESFRQNLVETADDEGMVHWYERDIEYDGHKDDSKA